MARRRAIEADELFETANRLQAEGKDVTATALLDALGGGSLRTIYKLLEVWEEKRPPVINTASTEIPADVMAGFSNTWRLVTMAADRSIQAAKDKAAEDVDAALQKFQVALDAADKLEAENEALAQQVEELKAKLAESEAAAHSAQAEAAGHKAAAEQLERLVAKAEHDLERVRREADEASKAERAERDAAIREAAELKGMATTLQTQNDQLMARLGDNKHEKRR